MLSSAAVSARISSSAAALFCPARCLIEPTSDSIVSEILMKNGPRRSALSRAQNAWKAGPMINGVSKITSHVKVVCATPPLAYRFLLPLPPPPVTMPLLLLVSPAAAGPTCSALAPPRSPR